MVLFCLLKDSAPLTPLLLDDLGDCGGYEFLQVSKPYLPASYRRLTVTGVYPGQRGGRGRGLH